MERHIEQEAVSEGTPPPPSDTGAQTALIDWLGVTFPDEVTFDSIYKLIGPDGWVNLERGGMGYHKGLIRGNVRILFDGTKGMGTHIEASGKGCRELEGDGHVSDWSIFLRNIIEAEGKYSRLDPAIDDKTGCLDMDKIEACVKSGCVVSRYKKGRLLSETNLSNGAEGGRTIYFGKPSSSTMIRIYDKAAQSGEGGNWIRVELQARNERANVLATILAYNGFEEVPGIIRGLVDFKMQGTNSQRERWDTQEWWNTFLDGAKKLRLSTAPAVRSVDKSYAWCKRQVAPTLAMLLTAFGGDLGMIDELINDGRRRMRPWHKALIAGALK